VWLLALNEEIVDQAKNALSLAAIEINVQVFTLELGDTLIIEEAYRKSEDKLVDFYHVALWTRGEHGLIWPQKSIWERRSDLTGAHLKGGIIQVNNQLLSRKPCDFHCRIRLLWATKSMATIASTALFTTVDSGSSCKKR